MCGATKGLVPMVIDISFSTPSYSWPIIQFRIRFSVFFPELPTVRSRLFQSLSFLI
ncbi:MAG: hypothetical protein ACI8YB_000958 [Patiriisocius sp.]